MGSVATATLAVRSMDLRAMSDWDWVSDSSTVEPGTVLLPLAFLLSCSRGSSWQR